MTADDLTFTTDPIDWDGPRGNHIHADSHGSWVGAEDR